MKTLVLLDAHALIHRAYHALPKFTSRNTGEPTGALYGLSAMLIKVIRELKPDYIAAAYDLPEPTFRHKEYKEYKATRREADEELVAQLERSKDIVKVFGIPILSAPGYEADDILGTVAEKLSAKGGKEKIKIIIVSGDMDALQLVVGDKVVVYTLRRGIEDTVLYDEKKVEERFGFKPSLLPDFKGLKGDPSDNIKGVPGIGDKTAGDLVKKFGTLENLYKALKNGKARELKERTAKTLLGNEKAALFSKKLATIKKDAPVEFQPEEFHPAEALPAVEKLFLELGFTSLLERFRAINHLEAKLPSEKKQLSLIEAEVQARLDSRPRLDSVDPRQKARQAAKLVKKAEKKFWADISAAADIYLLKEGEASYYILGKKEVWLFEEKFFKENLKKWQKEFSDKILVSVGVKEILKEPGKPDLKINRIFDCDLATWVSDSQAKKAFPGDARPEEAVKALPSLYKTLKERMKECGVEKVFYELELPLVFVLAKMEERGIKVDGGFLQEMEGELRAEISGTEDKIYKLAGAGINLNSPHQVGELLFDRLKISPPAGLKIKNTKGGKISTRESELLKLKDAHPVVNLILRHRESSKLLNTYVLPLFNLSERDGRIHTTYNQTGTVTGRLSSEYPNLQNIPIRAQSSAKIRNAFVSSPGYTLAAFDYAQIELKILAAFSGDEKMIKAFKDGVDIHRFTAASVNNVPLDKVTPEMRGRAKAVNFGIIYGMGIRQLALNTGMPLKEAAKFYEEYFKDFPNIKKYMGKVKKEAREKGFVSTLFGRKRFFDLAKINTSYLEAEMDRMAVNAVIQGSDADIVKKAMIDIDKWAKGKDIYPLLQIHDELVYEIRDDIISKAVPKIKELMENAVKLPIRFTVEAKIGKKLGELAAYGD